MRVGRLTRLKQVRPDEYVQLAVQKAVESAGTRYTTETSPLDSLTDTVDLAISVPLVGDAVVAEQKRLYE